MLRRQVLDEILKVSNLLAEIVTEQGLADFIITWIRSNLDNEEYLLH